MAEAAVVLPLQRPSARLQRGSSAEPRLSAVRAAPARRRRGAGAGASSAAVRLRARLQRLRLQRGSSAAPAPPRPGSWLRPHSGCGAAPAAARRPGGGSGAAPSLTNLASHSHSLTHSLLSLARLDWVARDGVSPLGPSEGLWVAGWPGRAARPRWSSASTARPRHRASQSVRTVTSPGSASPLRPVPHDVTPLLDPVRSTGRPPPSPPLPTPPPPHM